MTEGENFSYTRPEIMLKQTIYCGYLLVLALFVVVLSNPVKARDFSDFSDYGLGLAVMDSDPNISLAVSPAISQGLAYYTQRVAVKSGYYTGYNLYLSTDQPDLLGKTGSISSINNLAIGSPLAKNTWGYLLTDRGGQAQSGWQGFIDNSQPTVIASSDQQYPEYSEHYVQYGVSVGWQTGEGLYKGHVTYTLTPELPSTPVVLELSDVRYAIGSANNKLDLGGANLTQVEQVGVDFNGNNKIEDDEQCTNLVHADSTEISCYLPAGLSDGDFRLIAQTSTVTHDTGHSIEYYYQPKVNKVESADILVGDRLSITKVVSNQGSHLALANNGAIFQWGDLPWRNQRSAFTRTTNPAKVELPNNGDEWAVDIAIADNNYYALTNKGRVIEWGTRLNNGLTAILNGDQDEEYRYLPRYSDYFGDETGWYGSAIRAGRDFVAVMSGRNIQTWGSNQFGQLGQNISPSSGTREVSNITRGRHGDNIPITESDETIMDLATGAHFGVIATSKGRVYTWGRHGGADGQNGDGRLGFNTSSDAVRPHDITKGFDDYLFNFPNSGRWIVNLSAGDNFALGLTDIGQVYGWGDNSYGQIGNGNLIGGARQIELPLNQGENIIEITAHGFTAAARTDRGRLFIWGLVAGRAIAVPTLVTYFDGSDLHHQVRTVSLGDPTSYVVDNSGAIWQLSLDDLLGWTENNKPKNITSDFTHPRYDIALTGDYLNQAKLVWFDLNDDNQYQPSERVTEYTCQLNKCWGWLPTAQTRGVYNLHIETNYGGQEVTTISIGEI